MQQIAREAMGNLLAFGLQEKIAKEKGWERKQMECLFGIKCKQKGFINNK